MSSLNYNHPLPEPPHSQDIHPQANSTFSQYNTPFPPLEDHRQQPQSPYSAHTRQPPPQVETYTQRPPPVALASPKQQSPRNKPRGFSFRSDKSHKSQKSSGSHPRIDLTETTAEKETRRIHSKADPTLAMNEAEPAVVARTATTNAFSQPLSSLQHRDVNGNNISEPDRSNPTRSRWERPLDTIKSFESAIDSAYSRKSVYRSDSESVANFSRRTSHYGTNGGARFPHDSYYGSRSSMMMEPSRQSMMGGGVPRDGYFDGYQDPRNRMSRGPSDYTYQRPPPDRNGYPITSNHRSYETVASGSGGSASYGEPAGYQTDPSSENSSINRRSPPKRQEPTNDYGIGLGQAQPVQPTQATPRFAPQPSNIAVPPAQKATPASTGKLAKAGSTASNRPGVGEKRKSWFARRFSKNS